MAMLDPDTVCTPSSYETARLAAGAAIARSSAAASRSSARPAPRASRPGDGVLPLLQRRRSPPAARRSTSSPSAWPSSTGTSTTGTGRRTSSGATRRFFFASHPPVAVLARERRAGRRQRDDGERPARGRLRRRCLHRGDGANRRARDRGLRARPAPRLRRASTRPPATSSAGMQVTRRVRRDDAARPGALPRGRVRARRRLHGREPAGSRRGSALRLGQEQADRDEDEGSSGRELAPALWPRRLADGGRSTARMAAGTRRSRSWRTTPHRPGASMDADSAARRRDRPRLRPDEVGGDERATPPRRAQAATKRDAAAEHVAPPSLWRWRGRGRRPRARSSCARAPATTPGGAAGLSTCLRGRPDRSRTRVARA